MPRYQRDLLRRIREYLFDIEACLDDLETSQEGWQDEDRTYTPVERNLAVRLDRRRVPA